MTVIPLVAPRPETLNAKLERLASVVADEALAEEIPLGTRLEALKILTAWRVGVGKLKDKGEEDDPPPNGNFRAMQAAVANTEDSKE